MLVPKIETEENSAHVLWLLWAPLPWLVTAGITPQPSKSVHKTLAADPWWNVSMLPLTTCTQPHLQVSHSVRVHNIRVDGRPSACSTVPLNTCFQFSMILCKNKTLFVWMTCCTFSLRPPMSSRREVRSASYSKSAAWELCADSYKCTNLSIPAAPTQT